jgi:hypothetical protein
MASLRTNWLIVDLGVKQDIAHEIADGDAVLVCQPVPVKGTIKAVWVCADVLPAIGTCVVTNGGKADQVISTQDLAALTANTGTEQTLGTGVNVDAGDMLRATWTLTDIDSGVGFGCLVVIEPAVQ